MSKCNPANRRPVSKSKIGVATAGSHCRCRVFKSKLVDITTREHVLFEFVNANFYYTTSRSRLVFKAEVEVAIAVSRLVSISKVEIEVAIAMSRLV